MSEHRGYRALLPVTPCYSVSRGYTAMLSMGNSEPLSGCQQTWAEQSVSWRIVPGEGIME